jgi:hypothetical protein
MNLLALLEFDETEIGKFVRDHVCALCYGRLISRHADERKWGAYCITHGAIMDHNHIHRSQAEKADQNERMGLLELNELRPKERRSEAEILEELGF